MSVLALKSKSGTRGTPEKTRAAILTAAVHEFAEHGVAGARTDKIAEAAGVNKALLYYYFHDKENMYGAVLDQVFSGLLERVTPVFESNLAPREKLSQYVGTHFDYIAEFPEYTRLVQHEMMRAGRNRSPHLKRVGEKYLKPFFSMFAALLKQGVGTGDFREMNPIQAVPSIIAATTMYFSNTPMIRSILGADPLSPERIAERRAAVLDFVTAAVYNHDRVDRSSRVASKGTK